MKKYFIILIILTSAIFLSGIFLSRSFRLEEPIVFQIEKGQSSQDIALNLQRKGLINFAPIFRIYVIMRGKAGNLQAGCYFLSSSMNIPKIAEILSSGRIVKQTITIPEGFTSEQIYQKLKDVMPLGDFTLERLKEHEGYLFPDTYEIPYCMEQGEIIEMMLDNFNSKTVGLKITGETIIMASLLEKELKTKEDKEIASGILWKRLKAVMPLQVDAEPWTYENYGLSKKPISNPGLESIEAALNPKESQFWYYLSASDGTTIFSRTLEEHNIAKARYLK